MSLGSLFAELHMSDRRKRSISYPAKKNELSQKGAEFETNVLSRAERDVAQNI